MVQKTRITALGIMVCACLLGMIPAAQAQSSRDLSNRIKRLENELETLSRAVFKGEKPPPGSFDAVGNAGSRADLQVRLQQLEMELRTITGQIEEQNYEIRQLKDQVERMGADLELRIGDLERGGGAASSGPPGYTAAPPPSDADYGGGQRLGTISQPYVATPAARTSAAARDAAAAEYENAFALLKNSNYDAAETEFKKFLDRHPDHVLAGNAKYWYGETFYVRGEFEKAARIFAEGYQQYPKGAKAADNLLKLGMTLASMGNKSDACIALRQLEKEYSSGAGPVLRRAEAEKTRLGC